MAMIQSDTDVLRSAIQRSKETHFIPGHDATDAEALGITIAHYFGWDGQSIVACLQFALEDANWHTLVEKIDAVWKEHVGATT